MKRVFTALVLIILINTYAVGQIDKLAANIGYEYMHKNSGYLGAEYRINNNDLKNNNGPLNIGVGTYMYGNNGKFSIAPEIHLNQTWMHFLITEVSASTKNIKPSVGLSLMNLTRIQFGYSFPIDQSEFKGFYFGFHILIGRSPFYDEIKIY
ncbi:MAG TPA: hypothetical protein GX005_08485 [Bacteroidales bacterium]|nr:hypothetical protein [Bacteroidales bacterium]